MRSVAFSEYFVFSLLLIQALPSHSQNARTTNPKSTGKLRPAATVPPTVAPMSTVTASAVPATGPSTIPSNATPEASTTSTEPTTTISGYVIHDGRIGQAILVLLSVLGITLGAINMTFAWLIVWEFQLKHKIRIKKVVEKLELAEKRMNERAISDEMLGLLQSIGFDANKYEAEVSAYISQFVSQY